MLLPLNASRNLVKYPLGRYLLRQYESPVIGRNYIELGGHNDLRKIALRKFDLLALRNENYYSMMMKLLLNILSTAVKLFFIDA